MKENVEGQSRMKQLQDELEEIERERKETQGDPATHIYVCVYVCMHVLYHLAL